MPHTTMAAFAEALEGALRMPVVDETGLTERYDIEVASEMIGMETFRVTIHDQLGLLLTLLTRDESVLVVRDR